MLDDEARATLVDDVLGTSLKLLAKRGRRHGMDCEVVLSSGTEPYVIFSGELRSGGGAFTYHYKPRAAVEGIVNELERQYHLSVLKTQVPETGEIKVMRLADGFPLEPHLFNLACWATARMFHVVRLNIERLFEESLTEVAAEAFLLFRGSLTRALEADTGVHTPVDATTTIEQIIKARAESETKRLRTDFSGLPNVLAAPRRGRPPRITEASVRNNIMWCAEAGMPLAPKTIAGMLGVTNEGFRRWAIRQGYTDAEDALRALSQPPALS